MRHIQLIPYRRKSIAYGCSRHPSLVVCPTRDQERIRTGITLMETIFAIGVILTGLVGLAALIPIAAGNAKRAMELDRSISESTSAAAKGLAQNITDYSMMVMIDEPLQGSVPVAGTYAYQPLGNWQTIEAKLSYQQSSGTIAIGKLESPGYGHHPLGSGLTGSICLDPLGMPSPFLYTPQSSGSVTAADSAFAYSRFPYYSERYSVLNEPNAAIGNPGTAPAWPMSPRMWRVTLRSPQYAAPQPAAIPSPTPPPVARHQLSSPLTSKYQFSGFGELGLIDGGGEDVSKSLLLTQTNIGGTQLDASTDRSSQYTWFATIVPSFFDAKAARQSIVVVRQRVAPIPRRPSDVLALQTTSYTVDDADENPAAERVTWINPSETIGFAGGAGGDVRLYGSQAVSSDITAGEWVLLSRQPHLLDPMGNVTGPTGSAVHRWYRVLRTEEPEEVNGYAWPGGTDNVWRRWVTLAGSDWAFQDEATPVNAEAVDDTYCTIVSGAVSVIESEVRLP